MSTQRTYKSAFTRLELLVIVAVIAMLLAILLPALSTAGEAGRAAVCGTNLNQLSHGSFTYSEANDDRLPYYVLREGRPTGWEWWPTQIARGMEQFEPDIYRCPSDPLPKDLPIYIYEGNVYMADRGWHRGMPKRARNKRRLKLRLTYAGSCDLQVLEANCSKNATPPRTIDFNRPSRAIELIEGINANQLTGKNEFNQKLCYRFGGYGPTLAYGRGGRVYPSWHRHLGTTNLLFLDGHVDRLIPHDIGVLMVNQKRMCMTRFKQERYLQ